jgi:hypothetical protein
MLDSFFHKTNLFLCFSLLFIAFSSCQKSKSDELKILDSFLETNHTFNTVMLNHYKADYLQLQKETPEMNTEQLNSIATVYKEFISKINHSIASKESNIEPLVQEYNRLLDDLKNVLAKFYYKQFNLYIITANDLNFSNEYRLKAMKNNLTLSMVYAYQSANGNLISWRGCGFSRIRVKTIFDQHEDLAKITLTSNFIQTLKEEKDIIIDKIAFNGIDTKMKYNITEVHDFTDIILDSLTPGAYQIEGTVQYFDRNGKTAIPFREAFEIK